MEKIIEVVLSQAPDVVAQLVLVERMDCIGWFIFTLAAVIASQMLVRCGKKLPDTYDNREKRGAFIFFGWAFTVLFAPGLIINPINFISTFVAPKAVALTILMNRVKR